MTSHDSDLLYNCPGMCPTNHLSPLLPQALPQLLQLKRIERELNPFWASHFLNFFPLEQLPGPHPDQIRGSLKSSWSQRKVKVQCSNRCRCSELVAEKHCKSLPRNQLEKQKRTFLSRPALLKATEALGSRHVHQHKGSTLRLKRFQQSLMATHYIIMILQLIEWMRACKQPSSHQALEFRSST